MNQHLLWKQQSFYAPQRPMTLVKEVPYGPGGIYGADEVQYVVVQEDYEPTSPAEAASMQQLAMIAAPFITNSGKSAAKLQSDITYLKTLRKTFPAFKNIINKIIGKKRAQMDILEGEHEQETLRDKGFTYLTYGGVALLSAITFFFIVKAVRS
tara:strand:+ start:1088 stop:1549 length:462 start_codon:yes stop_codon:yes gene_type:complete